MAAERGIRYAKIGPKQSLLGKLFGPKPQAVYDTWRREVRERLSSAGFDDPAWDDSPDQDYVTDRPGWEGFVAFVAQFAYARHPEFEPPLNALDMDQLAASPAFEAEVDDQGSPVVAILSTQIFLPGTFAYAFSATGFHGGPMGVASIDLLDRAVRANCEFCDFNRSEIANSAVDQVGPDASFAEAAKYGTTIMARLVGEAMTRKLPLILDF